MRLYALIFILLLAMGSARGVGAAYHTITCDGNMSDWSDDESMGTINSATFYVTFDFANLYFGFHRGSTDNDMFIAIDVRDGGSNRSIDWYGEHTLPFKADFYVAIENKSYAYLKEYENGTWTDIYSLSSLGGYVEDWNVNIELKIPLKILGYPQRVNMIAYGQWENAVNVWAVWPVTNPMGMGTQNFTNYISLPVKEGINPSDYKYGVNFPKPKFRIDGYLTDWSGDENLTKIDDSPEDSAGDRKNVVENELYELYITWDANYLYLGYEYRTGVWGDSVYDNGTMVFIDTGTENGTNTMKNMNVWPRKIEFANFKCDYFFGEWDGKPGNFYHVIKRNFAEDISSQVIFASTGGNGVRGDVEIAIPWKTLYGDKYRDKMYNISGIKISAAVVGHDNETVLDTVPDVGDVTKDTNFKDDCTIDYFYTSGKIFTPPSLSIENVSYEIKNSTLTISWITNHMSKCMFSYESGGAEINKSFNYSKNFRYILQNVGREFNITIEAWDVYGNHVIKTITVKNESENGTATNTTSSNNVNLSPVWYSVIMALGIVIVGETYIWRKKK